MWGRDLIIKSDAILRSALLEMNLLSTFLLAPSSIPRSKKTPSPTHPSPDEWSTLPALFPCVPAIQNSKQPRPQPAQRLNIHLEANPRKMPYISEIYRNRLLLGRRPNTKSYQTIYFMAKKVIVTRDESVNCVFYIRTCRDCSVGECSRSTLRREVL
ncbi:hypothetical protein AVEN_253591-1 [Araneus ventricosus]|uniref:Uncharacterized protein n=1 Tax=Araneus ventricosus TaxID=182803 RepID=A0A4Y2C9Q6_ARAVE|nr:hypothetical protein AVEN_253591-1 [Araneus ventricosus]